MKEKVYHDNYTISLQKGWALDHAYLDSNNFLKTVTFNFRGRNCKVLSVIHIKPPSMPINACTHSAKNVPNMFVNQIL
jgi:hypothetical protein